MARTPTEIKKAPEVPNIGKKFEGDVIEMQNGNVERRIAAHKVASEIGYVVETGVILESALISEIRFYQRKTVEACLELGKRLLILKEMSPHGTFTPKIEELGISKASASRFMNAAVKVSKSSNLELLSGVIKSQSAFLELVTCEDEELEQLKDLDEVEKMSASQLRAKVRELKEEGVAKDRVLETKNKEIDKLQLIHVKPKMDKYDAVCKRSQSVTAEAVVSVKGGLRQALVALYEFSNSGEDGVPRQAVIAQMTGLVEQVQAELDAVRNEFGIESKTNAMPEWLGEPDANA